MTAVWARARADLRSGLRSTVALALVGGLVGGLAMAASAAARRTDTAYARFLAATRPPQVFVISGTPALQDQVPVVDLRRVLRLPQVAQGLIDRAVFGVALTPGGDVLFNGDLNISALPTAAQAKVFFQPKLLSGRLPDPGRTDEVAVGYRRNPDPRMRVGATLQVALVKAGTDANAVFQGGLPRRDYLDPVRVKVVGVVLSQGEFQGSHDLFITARFARTNAPRAFSLPAAGARLRNGIADLPAFNRALDAIAPGALSFSIRDEAVFVNRSTHLLAIALWLFAALAALAGLLTLGQALARQILLGATENPTLRALGMSSPQMFGVAMVWAALIGGAGAALAVTTAFLLSALAPIGALARLAEPHPGLSFDALVLGGGAGLVVLVVLAAAVGPAWSAAGVQGNGAGVAEPAGRGRASTVAGAFARGGLPPTAVAGVRLALEPGRGRSSVPVQSTILGATLTVAAVATALTFGASFHHLLDSPRLYGSDFDIGVGNPYAGPRLAQAVIPVLRRDPAVRAFSSGNIRGFVQVGGEERDARVNVWAFQPEEGSVHPTVAAGRWPRSDREIVLGAKTLREIGAQEGGTVSVRVGRRTSTMRVVGHAVFPEGGFGPGLAEGAGLTLDGLRRFVPGATVNVMLVRLAPGADPGPEIRHLNRVLEPYGADAFGTDHGESLENLKRIEWLPLLLAGILALAGAGSLVHTLVTSIRRRRRDLAILKTVGFVRRQVSFTVAWQATTIVVAALLIGLPLGIASGRWAWRVFADQLGVVPAPVVALGATLLVVPAVLVAANLVAAVPGLVAARTRPATILRSE